MTTEPNNQNYERVGDVVSIFSRGKTWYANFQHDGKQKRQSLKTTSKKRARQLAIRLEASLSEGRYQEKVLAPRLEKVIDAHLDHLRSLGRADRTLSKIELVGRRLKDLASRSGVRTILDVTLPIVDAYRAEQVNVHKAGDPKTVLNHAVIIRQIVNFALSRKMITTDPLQGITFEKVKPKPQPWWQWEQVEQILAASAGHRHYHPALVMLARTGMRVGELEHLMWADVDLENGVFHIRAKEIAPGIWWTPKTGNARVVPISTPVRDLLERQPRHCRWVFAARRSKKYPNGDHHVSQRRVLVYLKKILKRLGLPGHVHTFRHSFISFALIGGMPPALLRRWVGQIDAQIMELYTHIADGYSQAAMQRLAETMTNTLQLMEKNDECQGTETDVGSAHFQHTEEAHEEA